MQMVGLLSLVYLSALFNNFSIQTFLTGFIAVTACLAFDFLFWKIRKIPPFMPSAALVTGLIIACLLTPNSAWYVTILTAAVAMAFKNFLRVGGRHIFNPASIGLFVTGILFQQPVSWWAASFQAFSLDIKSLIFFIILLGPGLVSAYTMKRYRIILSFLLVYGLILLFRSGFNINPDTLKLAFLDPTVLFFSLVMLPEPRTSPNQFKWQIIFGVSVAVLAFLVPFLNTGSFILIPDPLIAALLIGNLIFLNK